MVNHRQWGSQNPLRQFRGLPNGPVAKVFQPFRPLGHAGIIEILTKLEKRDIPWERYYDMSSQVGAAAVVRGDCYAQRNVLVAPAVCPESVWLGCLGGC
eukprot:1160128-Pelagomonas_calceolata.AAC.2